MTQKKAAREVFLLGLRNAHAMEKQALSIMQPQINRLNHYPDLERRLQEHVAETRTQIERLDRILETVGEGPSMVKDGFLSAMGSMAALGHVTAGDEVLKNSFANLAFENYEIGAYVGLLTSADLAGEDAAMPLLEQSLDEERRMADWVERNIPVVTEAYINLEGSGERAKV